MGDDFGDFLFAFQHIKSLLKRPALKGKNLLPWGANYLRLEQTLFLEGKEHNFDIVASLGSVSVLLHISYGICFRALS